METAGGGQGPGPWQANLGPMTEATTMRGRPAMSATLPTAAPPTTARRLASRLLALVLLGWGLGVLLVHVVGGFAHAHLDRPVNRWFHHHQVGAVTKAMARVSPFGATPVVLVVVVVGAAAAVRRRNRALAVTLAVAGGGGMAIALSVKLLVRKGQGDALGGLSGISQLAFPSGHATLSAAVYGTMAVLLAVGAARTATGHGRRLRAAAAWALVGLTLAIGVSRVYRGQHDPTDVLAGWLLGGLWARAVTAPVRRPRPGSQASASWADR